jgi:uncharacterized membrane protein YccC
VTFGVALALSCLVSYEIATELLTRVRSVSTTDDVLGGMWATVATAFVFRSTNEQSTKAASSRMAATGVSFVLCLAYLAFLPFHPWGMALLIGIGAIVLTLGGRPNDVVTAAITIAVIMVVARLSPHNAWQQPILRLGDTAVGVRVGVVAAASFDMTRGDRRAPSATPRSTATSVTPLRAPVRPEGFSTRVI